MSERAQGIRFLAQLIDVTEDDGVWIVSLADDAAEAPSYVMLQRTLDPGEQDVRLGLAGVYLERDDQRWSCYDGIHLCILDRRRLRIELSAAGKEALRCDGLDVQLAIEDDVYERLRNGLERILGSGGRFRHAAS